MEDIKLQIKYCECGCGEPAPIANRNWHNKGIKKGDHLRFVCGHHRRNKEQSVEEKIKRVRSWGIDNASISPYLPGNKVIRYNATSKRWYASSGKGSGKKPHARMVYEHHFGQIPEDYVVHHKSGKASAIEDDNPSNLMIVPHKWNWHYFPRLSQGFGVPESVVTEFYIELYTQHKDERLFMEVCRKLIEYKEKEFVNA